MGHNFYLTMSVVAINMYRARGHSRAIIHTKSTVSNGLHTRHSYSCVVRGYLR